LSLLDGAAIFGGRTKVPSIWFYGDNDTLFPQATWRAMFDHYTRAGGRAELVDVGSVMKDSHVFLAYPEVLPVWTAALDGFLRRIGMQAAALYPNDLPKPFPAASHFADVNDVSVVPYLNDKGRTLYQSFLKEPFPRVFIVATNGGAGNLFGGLDPLGRGLAACGSAGATCQVYAVDDRVVWRKPEGMEQHGFAMTIGSGQTRRVDFSVRLNPDCSAKAFPQFRVVQAPAHGRLTIGQSAGTPRFPAGSPFAVCNSVKPMGTAVEYTAAPGYTGADTFAFTSADGGAQAPVLRFDVTVTMPY
jgi:hypothetical protein